MSRMGALFAVLYCWLIGWAILRIVHRNAVMPSGLSIGLAYPLGAGIVGVAAYFQILFQWPIPFAVAVFSGLAAVAYILFRTRKISLPRLTMPPPLIIFILSLTGLAFILAALLPYRGGDGVWVHAFKARHLLADNSMLNPIFLDPMIVHSNETTPLWAPALIRFAAILGGGWSEPWPHLVLIPFYPSLLFIFFGALQEKTGSKTASWLTAALALVPAFGMPLGGVYSHYVDIPMSAFILGAVVLAFRFTERPDAGTASCASILLFIMIFVKNEGLPVAAAMAATWIAVCIPGISTRRPLIRGIGVPLLLLGWTLPFHFLFRAMIPRTHDQFWFHNFTPENLELNVQRIPVILKMTAAEFVNIGHWGLWWPAFFAAVFSAVLWRRKAAFHLPAAPVAAMLAAVFVIYWQDYMNFVFHIRWSFDRILLQLLPCAAFFTVLVFHSLFNPRHDAPDIRG